MADSAGSPGEAIDLEVTDVAHGGVFVARHEGRVVFVPDAIPGERVRARLAHPPAGSASDGRRFWRAEAIEVLEASPHRRAHVWRQADIGVPPSLRPGGADFGHIELGHQRQLKLRVIVDALRRIGRIDLPVGIEEARAVVGADGVVVAEESADASRWRTRVSLHVDADGRVGPYAARSHRVIEVDDLPLATSAIERAASRLGRGGPGRIDLVQPADGRVRTIVRPDGAHRTRGRRAARASPLPSAAGEVVIESALDREFRVDAGGFWQVHRLAAHSLTALVGDRLRALRADGPAIDPTASHLDLYGGVGLFAATLAMLGGPSTRVTSIESDARATAHAVENLAEWEGARAETARVDRWLARLRAEAPADERARLARGVVVLDPPRSGARREVVERVAALSPAAIVYVACDPVALARDLGTFREHGYEAAQVDAIDLFPHSHHIEAVAVLTRASARE